MITWALGGIGLIVLAFILLSPLESLRWWADKGERELATTFDEVPALPQHSSPSENFVVYLSGVGLLDGKQLSRREQAWLKHLDEELPEWRVVADVFPYAVDNRGLLARATKRLWIMLDWLRRRWPWVRVHLLINVRNIAQVLVSADPRYGPTFNIGLAQEIWRSLQRHGYRPGSGTPVVLVGFSGGAQMALGAGWFLHALGIPVSLISVGGIFADDPGLDRMQHVWQLRGAKDRAHLIGSFAFPGRWIIAPLSTWGRAKRERRVTRRLIGPMGHDGPRGYFGRRALDAEGRSFSDLTRAAVADILRERG
ncbi:MAG: hypothetical protein Q4G35_09615 [Propionibacteriaceae bacterium]|nr:hypothetical protein [Propionibacteriaceae bacterium]